MIKEEKLTSVKITQPLFDEFNVAAFRDNFSFKKLYESPFKAKINLKKY